MHSLRFEPESPRWHVRILLVRPPTTTGTTRLANTSTASMTQLLFLFGELKPEYSSNNRLLATDLYRLVIFMKEEINLKNLQMTIGFQLVGMFVIQFLSLHVLISIISRLKCQVLWYRVVSLYYLQVCCAVPKLCFCCSTLLIILSQIYSNKCVEPNLNMQPYQCPTLPKEMLDEMPMKYKSK